MVRFDGGVSHPTVASGPVDDLNRHYGRGHLSTINAGLVYAVSVVLTATVAVTFGEYAGALLNSSIKASIGALAAGIILAVTALRIWGTRTIGRAQGPIVAVVAAMLAILAVVTRVIAGTVPAFVGLLGLGILAFTATHRVRPTLHGRGIFGPITVSHLQIYRETGARLPRLALASLTIVILLVVCVLEIRLNGVTAMMTVIAIAGLAVILDVLRSRIRTSQPSSPPQLAVLKGGLHEY